MSTALGAKINFSISEKDAACWFSIVKLCALGWAQHGSLQEAAMAASPAQGIFPREDLASPSVLRAQV